MQLLCLTDHGPDAALPGLALLAHEIRTAPLAVQVPAPTAERFDLVLVDGTADIRLAWTQCLDLRRDWSIPRVLLTTESALSAVTPEWGVAEVILTAASPSEIELRLRLAAGRGASQR